MSRRPRRKQPGKPRVPVEQGLFLTIGVPEGSAGKVQLKRAAEILQRHGYRVGVTSPEAILAAADLIRDDQKKLADQAAGDPEPQPQGDREHDGDPELA